MRLIATCSLLFLLGFASVIAQDDELIFPEQDTVARKFLSHVLTRDYRGGWDMLGETGSRTFESFADMGEQINKIADYFTPEVAYLMAQLSSDGTLKLTYKFVADITRDGPGAVLWVTFAEDNVRAVTGFGVNTRGAPAVHRTGPVPTSTGIEEEIDGEQTWIVNDDTVQVNQVALVHGDDGGFIVVKIFRAFERATFTAEQAETIALPIVRYAVKKGYLKRARSAAERAGINFHEDIAVAIIQPATWNAYRVIFAPEQYR